MQSPRPNYTPHDIYRRLKRKNFLPTLLFVLFLWAALGGVVYFTDPAALFSLIVFFIILFLAFLYTFSLILASTRRGFLIALALSLFIILRYLGVGTWLNFILIVAIAVCAELYFTLR